METVPPHGRVRFDIVVPTVRRRSFDVLLDKLALDRPEGLERVIVVDDRTQSDEPIRPPAPLDAATVVVTGEGRGLAAARNQGWPLGAAPWVVFLDDDVFLDAAWADEIERDLARAAPAVGGVQGRIHVPIPEGRPPTDWERSVRALEEAAWITSDMAYRRELLEAVGGFDEDLPQADREAADLALRAKAAGWEVTSGRRRVTRPVDAAPWWISVSRQAANADDARMARRHGRGWRAAAKERPGRLTRDVTTTAVAAAGIIAVLTGHRRVAVLAGAAWATETGRFAWDRIAPGPRTATEVAAVAVTSIAIPPVACFHRARGELRSRWTSKGASHAGAGTGCPAAERHH